MELRSVMGEDKGLAQRSRPENPRLAG
jgi:hypothetical protein